MVAKGAAKRGGNKRTRQQDDDGSSATKRRLPSRACRATDSDATDSHADDAAATVEAGDELSAPLSPPAAEAPSASSSASPPAPATSSETAAVAAPSFSFLPASPIRLSAFDIARKLQLDLSHLAITGDKGYRTCRATHGLSSGSLYFELTFLPPPANPASSDDPAPAVRVGVCTLQGDIDACVGIDRWGYGMSSRGWRGHDGVWEEWEGGEWKAGDVIGVWLQLGAADAERRRPRPERREPEPARDPVREDKKGGKGKPKAKRGNRKSQDAHNRDDDCDTKLHDADASQHDPQADNKPAAPAIDVSATNGHGELVSSAAASSPSSSSASSPVSAATGPPGLDPTLSALLTQQKAAIFFLGSSLTFFRNGQQLGTAFTDLFRGTYFPAVSLYMKARAALCFGPAFTCVPHEVSGGWWPPLEDDGDEGREQLVLRGLLRFTGDGTTGGGLVENARHRERQREKEREKQEEEREKARRAKEKEMQAERERAEKANKGDSHRDRAAHKDAAPLGRRAALSS